jgi:predicted RNase H-like HicB family nuclease
MAQRYTIQAVVYPGNESGYVAECLNLAVVTQGKTLDETVQNLREAIELHLEGEESRFPYREMLRLRLSMTSMVFFNTLCKVA